MKKTSLLLRALLLTLSLLMVLGGLAACGTEAGKTPNQTGNSNTAGNATTDDPRYDAEGYLKDSLPADLNFNKSVLILTGAEQKWHVGAMTEEENADNVVGKTIFARNETVQDRLGIEITWDLHPNFQGSDQSAFMQKLESDIKSSGEYDTVVSYNLLPYTLAMKGYLENLATTEYIDLTAPWWPSAFMEQILYQGQLYALVNNSGKGSLENMSAIFFNNDLLEDYNVESPYELVAKNEWTVAKLKELIQGTYQDLNANGKVDEKDQFGLSTSTNARLTCWYVGMGLKLITRDENGDLHLTAGNAKTGEVIDSIVNLFSTTDSMLVDPLNGSNNNFAMFTEKRCLFYLATLWTAEYSVTNNLDLNYGVVPNPKLDSEQTRYYTHMPNNHPIWYIPNTAKNVDCSSALIECMASEAYRQVAPVYYENCVKLRYAPDERLADMYDLVRESITFDMNYVFRFVYPKDCDTWIRNCISNPDVHKWTSTWAGIRSMIETKFNEIVTIYGERSVDLEQQ